MKAVVAAFNQEKALVGTFSVIVQPVVEPMDRFAALLRTSHINHNPANIGYSLELKNLDNTKRQGDRWTIDRAIASGGLR